MINLDKCTGSINVLSPKICVPKEIKYVNVEAKTMTKHISWDGKYKFNSATYNSNQKWNNKTC